MQSKISAFKSHLENEIRRVKNEARLYDSDGDIHDDGAHEYIGEIQSVIDVINQGMSESAIKDACNWVAISYKGFLSC
jgi:hypothetical protein